MSDSNKHIPMGLDAEDFLHIQCSFLLWAETDGRLIGMAVRKLDQAAERSSHWIWLKRSNRSWKPTLIDHHCGPPILRVF